MPGFVGAAIVDKTHATEPPNLSTYIDTYGFHMNIRTQLVLGYNFNWNYIALH